MALGGRKVRSAPQHRKQTFPFPIVAVVALPLLAALDIPGLHALDQSWTTAAIGGGIAAVLGALFAWVWFGGPSRIEREIYFWPRLIGLAVGSVVFGAIILLLLSWPLLTSVAGGVSAALVGGMALMAATGDL